jgi:subtilisin family serine protease
MAASTASISIGAGDYGYMSGTSMATPGVSGVAALVWSNHPNCTGTQIREALKATAKDAGAAGKDDFFGHGIVKAKDASDYLTANGCGGGSEPPADAPANLTGSKVFSKGKYTYTLNWTGGASTVDVYFGTSKVKSAISNSFSTTYSNKNLGSFKVCNAGTTDCSNSVTP